jgi:hypothetical protein
MHKRMQTVKSALLRVLLDHDLANGTCTGLIAATARTLNVSEQVVRTGLENKLKLTDEQFLEQLCDDTLDKRRTRIDKYPRQLVYNFFGHGGDLPDHSAYIEPDKDASKKNYTKKKFVLGGEEITLSCFMKIRTASRLTCAKEYQFSETNLQYVITICSLLCLLTQLQMYLNRYEESHPGSKLSLIQIMACMCPCITAAKIRECACPICTDMECLLRAFNKHFKSCPTKCDCCKAYSSAMSSIDELMRRLSCAETVLPGMRRDGCDKDFCMRPVKCCVSSGDIGGLEPCPTCCFANRLPRGNCSSFSRYSLNREVTWLKHQDTVEGKNRDRVVKRLRTFKGKFSELLREIEERAKPLMYHLWKARFLRRCFHLDCDFFNPLTEAVLLTDFASVTVISTLYLHFCSMTLFSKY